MPTMAYFSFIVLAVIAVGMTIQVYKIKTLNGELQDQIIISKETENSLQTDLYEWKQRTKKCSSGLVIQKLESSDLAKQLKQQQANAASQSKIQQEIQNDKLNLEEKLKTAQANLKEALKKVTALITERENAIKEAEHYYNLYLKGNNTLNAILKECMKTNVTIPKPIGQMVNEINNASLKERMLRETNTGNDTGAHQQDPSANTTSGSQTQDKNEAKENEEEKEDGKKTEQESEKEGRLKEEDDTNGEEEDEQKVNEQEANDDNNEGDEEDETEGEKKGK